MKEREISMRKRGYKRFFESSTKKRIEYRKNEDEFFILLTSHSGTFWWDSSRAGINGLCTYPSQVEKVFHGGRSWNFQSMLGNGLIPGGNERDKAHQAVLSDTNASFLK